MFLVKITSLRVVICPVVYPKDHISVRCYSQCMRASSLTSSVDAMGRCISAIRCWMIKDKLKVNDSTTKLILIGTRQQLAKVDIKGLDKMCKTLSFHLYSIRRVRKYLS